MNPTAFFCQIWGQLKVVRVDQERLPFYLIQIPEFYHRNSLGKSTQQPDPSKIKICGITVRV